MPSLGFHTCAEALYSHTYMHILFPCFPVSISVSLFISLCVCVCVFLSVAVSPHFHTQVNIMSLKRMIEASVTVSVVSTLVLL